MLNRPNGDPARPETVSPGLHRISVRQNLLGAQGAPASRGPHGAFSAPWGGTERSGAAGSPPATEPGSGAEPRLSVVWWDPRALDLRAEHRRGLRREELIDKHVPEDVVQQGLRSYERWKVWRRDAIEQGSRPSVLIRTATEHAEQQVALAELGLASDLSPLDGAAGPPEDLILLARDGARPSGPRYGSLVHAVLAVVPLDAGVQQIAEVAALEARIFGATDLEREAAASVVERVLGHDVMDRARRAARDGRCRREVPLAFREPDGTLVEGIVDLAFEEDEGWTVVDFKTDQELGESERLYRYQVRLYAQAIAAATSRPATPVLVSL